ncbi:NCOA5 family protein [Megaselia abdita]
MGDTRPEGNNLGLIKDPNLAKNRIFLGNIPVCTKEELESIGGPYGTVIASMVKDKFAFLQFESEEVANKAAKALHKSTFKGKPINVRNAGYQKPPTSKPPANASILPPPILESNPDINDCEIIVVNKNNT